MVSDFDAQLGLRLQEEHKALLQLSQVLREHIAAMPTTDQGPWLSGLRVAFDRLHVHVERCIAMKTKNGYLETILRERPALTRQVEAVKREHGQILRLGEEIRASLQAIKSDENLLVVEACARVQRYMSIVTQHEQKENMIVLFAFNQDMGAF